jgi:ankyrin repeat protein
MMNSRLSHLACRAVLPLSLLFFSGCATPLMKAAGAGDNDQVKALLDAGADPNAQKGGALFSAVSANKLDTMKLLLSRGARADSHGFVICPAQKQSALSALFAKEQDVPQEAPVLVIDTHNGNLKAMKMLVDAGADVNGEVVRTMQWPCNGYTSLIFAAKDGNVEAVRFLLDHGADRNAHGGRWGGKTALEWLQKDGGDPDIMAILDGSAPARTPKPRPEAAPAPADGTQL